jgi:DNA-binding MarR family transcriptional regulator
MADQADRPADTGPSARPSVGFTLSQLGFATSSGFGQRVGTLGLEPRHYAVLRALRAADSQSQQAVADRLQIPPSTMVSLVDHLEKEGLLERQTHAADRRTRHLRLTPAGVQVLEEAIRLGDEWEQQICAGLSGAERDQLLRLLRKVAANVGIRQDTLPDRGTGQRPQPLAPGSPGASAGHPPQR